MIGGIREGRRLCVGGEGTMCRHESSLRGSTLGWDRRGDAFEQYLEVLLLYVVVGTMDMVRRVVTGGE
jgi:hypothetical protein